MPAQVYRGVVELCVVRYRDAEGLYVGTREAAFCALRAQLLMALHDAGATELCSQVLAVPMDLTAVGSLHGGGKPVQRKRLSLVSEARAQRHHL
jgi:Cofactor of BRCA1 (COBRA1)